MDEKLAAERSIVESLQSQAAAARAALEAEQALVAQLKEEATVSSAAAQQLMALEQQVGCCLDGSGLGGKGVSVQHMCGGALDDAVRRRHKQASAGL